MHQLPSPVDTEVEDESQPEVDDKKMTIAWRYENLKPSLSTSKSDTEFGHYFDLSKNIDSKVLKKADLEFWSHDKGEFSREQKNR